ncbi:MAG: DUF3810 family protein [Luteitalea sp.]|nr:DUF3810 family protein [Luteitalea sp.]
MGVGVHHLPARDSANHRTGYPAGVTSVKARHVTTTKLAVVASAVLVAVVPLPATFVEQAFSGRTYLFFQPLVTATSNHVPFFLLDLALAGMVAAAMVMVGRRFRRRAVGRGFPGLSGIEGSRAVGAVGAPKGAPCKGAPYLKESGLPSERWGRARVAASNLVVLTAAIYLAFEACWGLNYQRLPLATRFDFDRGRVTPGRATAWVRTAIGRLNRGHPEAYAEPWPSARDLPGRLGPAFARSQRLLGARRVATPGVPKPTLLAPYFRWAGVDGVTNPFGLDIAVNPHVTPAERPFVVAHEWGHLAGFANEAEANFFAWLTCMQGDAQAQYSGWLSVLGHLVEPVARDERRQLLAALDGGPRRDLAAMAARSQQTLRPVRVIAWGTYDRFLRANRVEGGMASYSLVTELLLGVRFDDAWRPALKKGPL